MPPLPPYLFAAIIAGLLIFIFWITPPRAINWLFFGCGLSLVPLLGVALTEWKPEDSFTNILTKSHDLLAVAFTLSAAAGVDALVAEGANQRIKRWIGGATLTTAITIAGLYFLFKTNSHHLSPESVESTELVSYAVAAFLSFCSEVVAEA